VKHLTHSPANAYNRQVSAHHRIAGIEVIEPNMNAAKFVAEVTVMDMPPNERACRKRSGMGASRFLAVTSSMLRTITKTSSTPTPRMMNGISCSAHARSTLIIDYPASVESKTEFKPKFRTKFNLKNEMDLNFEF
jgi:hypothetical protein